jgi:hypothetical protein
MTGRLASGRAGLRRWARRGLMLALPLGLLALAPAAFVVAPSSISHRAGVRPDLRLLPPTPRTSAPAPATRRFAVAPATVSGGGPTQSRPRRVGQRWRAVR